MTLRQALEECTLALLRRIASCRGVPAGDAVLRVELIEALHARLLEQAQAGSSQLPGLTPAEIEVLGFLRDHGWTAKALLLERLHPRGGPVRRGAPRGELPPTISLLQCGVVFRGYASVGDWRGEVYYVPDELQAALGELLPPSSATRRPDVLSRVTPSREEEPTFYHDVFCLLSFLRRKERKLSNGTLAETELARLEREAGLSPSPGGPDLGRWRFLLQVCRAGGWVTRQGRALRPSSRAVRLLEGGPDGTRKLLLESYLRDEAWSDLAAVGRSGQPLGSRRIRERDSRRLLVHYLDELVGARWSDERAFVEAVRALDPDLLREDYASLSWAVTDIASGVELQGPESWDAVEGEWIRFLLRGPLRWIGVVQWGFDEKGERCAFRKAGLAAASPDEKPSPAVTIDDQLNVTVPRGGDLALLYQLEKYLELRGGSADSAYRITRESVLSGMEGGGSWEELSSILRAIAPPDRLDAISDRVEAWAREYGRFVLATVLLLTAATPEDAEALRSTDEARACLRSRVNSRSFEVIPERARELLERLRRAGFSVRVDGPADHYGVRRALQDAGLVGTCLEALRLVEALHPGLIPDAGKAIRSLEAILTPESVEEATKRVDAAVRRTMGLT